MQRGNSPLIQKSPCHKIRHPVACHSERSVTESKKPVALSAISLVERRDPSTSLRMTRRRSATYFTVFKHDGGTDNARPGALYGLRGLYSGKSRNLAQNPAIYCLGRVARILLCSSSVSDSMRALSCWVSSVSF